MMSVVEMPVELTGREVAPPMPSGHIATLDGLRGVAILLVMLCHFLGLLHTGNHRLDSLLHLGFGHGWVGVNLFFVLSGFLITGILLDAKSSPRYFRNFYARRTLRIFPLYYGVLFVCFAILPLFPGSNSADFLALRSRQGWLWTYCTNIKIVLDGDWKFATPLLDLGHFWSLAVEEHFYLVWPLLVFLLPTRALVKACIGVIVVAGLARTWWVIAH